MTYNLLKNKKTLGVLSFSTLMLANCGQQKEVDPNILFILVDDMQRDAIAALGNEDTITPNIDALVKRGVNFTNTYTNGALCGALSMPSRAMLMTGRGVFDIQSDGMKIPECHKTFPEVFRENGYRTFGTGKWHADRASYTRSFSEGENIFFGGMHRYEDNGHCSPHLNHYDPTGEYKETKFIGEDFSSKMFADATIDFLKTVRKEKKPFLAYVAFTSPHDPRNQHPDYGHKYKAEDVSLPDNFLPEHPFDNGDLRERDELLLPVPRKEDDMQHELADYYGMVSEVDLQIGRVIRALEETGEKDNTIIVFASDNGLAMGQNGLIGKQNLYEHSVGVPLVIIDPRYSDIQSFTTTAKCYLYDIFPTLCDMANLPIPESVLGKSLNGIISGTETKIRDEIFLSYSNLQRAIIKDDYKYIIYNVGGVITEQFFNLKDDPGEMNNLLPHEKAEEYRKLLARKMKENGDFCDLDNPLWWNDGHKIQWEELIKLYIYE